MRETSELLTEDPSHFMRSSLKRSVFKNVIKGEISVGSARFRTARNNLFRDTDVQREAKLKCKVESYIVEILSGGAI